MKIQYGTKTIEFDALSDWGIQAGGFMVILVTLIVLYVGVLPNEFISWATQSVIW